MFFSNWFDRSAQSARRHSQVRSSVRRKFLGMESLENRQLLAGLPPVDISLSATVVNENVPANHEVGEFSTDDPDTLANQFTYTLVSGPGSDDNGSFNIDGQQLQTSQLLDAEAKAVYSIRVQTEDPDGNAIQKVFEITVNNLNDNLPVFDGASSFDVAENTTAVGTVAATDADNLAALVYSIDPNSPDAARFSADPDTGALSFVSAPNFEGPADVGGDNVYHVTVEADDGQHTVQQAVAVTVENRNEAPILDTSLNPTLAIVREDAIDPASTLVASLLTGAVTEPDGSPLRGIAVTAASNYNGNWEYLLSKGSSWQPMGSVSDSAARLLPGSARVRFLPKANFAGTVKLWYRAWDQTQGSAGATFNAAANTGGTKAFSVAKEGAALTVTPVNDPPTLSMSGPLSYTRDKPAITLAPFARLADFDSPNFQGGRLRVWITEGVSTSNRVVIGGGFTVDSNQNVLLNGINIGKRTINGFGTKEMVVVFTAKATPAVAQQLVRAIMFKTVGGSAGKRTLMFSVSDGDGGLSNVAVKTVNVK